jgi:hypothetical protein
LARLVDPAGTILLTTPNGDFCRNQRPRFSTCADPSVFESAQFSPHADGHIFLLHVDEVSGLAAAAGLMVRECRLFTNFLTQGWAGTGAIASRLPTPVVERIERLTRRVPAFAQRKIQTQMAVVLEPTRGAGK